MKIKFEIRRLLCCRLSRKVKSILLLCPMLCPVALYASPGQMEQTSVQQTSQQKTILVNGIITDVQGEPLIGVNVIVKGAAGGTITDIDGKFSVKVPNENSTLQFSYIGFKPKTKIVGKDRVLKIVLESDNRVMDEVVVVGYGTAKRRDLTGSVGRVDVEELQKAPVKSLDDALAGRVAGVQVTSGDGQPGSNAEIIVRGVGSVTQSSAPLYVIDGFPQEDANFNSINTTDIESVEVLKDASSTAIYGARGSNGVILITTKRGKSEKPTITYNGYYGVQTPVKKMTMLDGYEFARLENDITPGYATTNYYVNGMTLEDYKTIKGINWQDKVLRDTPAFQNHSISIAGKANKVAYTASGSYTDQEGLVTKTGFERYQGRLTMDLDVTDKLKVGVNVNYAKAITTGQAGNASQGTYFTFMSNLWSYRPLLSGGASEAAYENFVENDLMDDEATSTQLNPYIATTNANVVNTNTSLTPNGYLQYKLTKDLTLRTTIGLTLTDVLGEVFNNSKTFDGNPWTGFGKTYGVNASRNSVNNYSLLNENTLTYNKKFNKNNVLNAVVGFTDQQNTTKSYYYRVAQIPLESMGMSGMGLGTPFSTTSYSSLSRMESFLGRVNYSLRDRYLFTASMRADGSSKFAPGNRWGYFPSGAFAWRINQEKFLKNIRQIDNAKLRISYGATGNNRVDDFAYMTTVSMTNSASTFTSSFVPFNNINNNLIQINNLLGNQNLKWETGVQSDIGLDLSLFNSRLNVELDYYDRTTKNLLIKSTLPAFTGFSTGWLNVGEVKNSGVELAINTVNIKNKTFTWTTNFNITFNKNQLVSLNSGLNQMSSTISLNGRSSTVPTYISVVGQPVGMIYGWEFDGVYQQSDFYRVQNGANGYLWVLKEGIPYPKASLKNSITSIGTVDKSIQPGDYKYKDLNGDGVIDVNDATVIGNPYPLHFGGLTNTFSYKNFDLSVFLQWSYGNDIINANRVFFEGTWGGQSSATTGNVGMILNNQFASYANRWTLTNPSNLYERVDPAAETSRFTSSRVVEDGSYLRLKTIQLSYRVPNKYVKILGLSSARFYISGQNLLTLTGYSGIDPEVTTSRAGNMYTTGLDLSPYPRTKVITLGTSITL